MAKKEYDLLTAAYTSAILQPSQLERAFPKQDIRPPRRLCGEAEAIRTAGSTAENRALRLATSVALLIELEAQFYKLVTIN